MYKDTLRSINVVCFTTSIVCIIAGAALSIIFIWGEVDSMIVGKILLSLVILIMGSVMTLFVNLVVGSRIVIGNSRYELDEDNG